MIGHSRCARGSDAEFVEVEFSELLGKTLKSCSANYGTLNDDEIDFVCSAGEQYILRHLDDCCEQVWLTEIHGRLTDLVGVPIAMAEASTNKDTPPMAHPDEFQYQGSHTWTFYRLATSKGYVTIRWYGTSNGYYSEEATLLRNIQN